MATNFPGGIDTFVNPNSTSSLDSPSHSGLHTDLGDAMTAVQTELVNNPYGLVHINTASFSASSAESFNDVFSATYDSYKIVLNLKGSTNLSILFRLRVSGSDDSGSNYSNSNLLNTFTNATTLANGTGAGTSQSAHYPLFITTNKHLGIIEIANPFISAERTFSNWRSSSGDASANFNLWGAGLHNQTVSYTGFSLIASTGNFTGEILTFGYRKS
jgi:hypothetical protein